MQPNKKISYSALFIALAMIFSYIEFLLPLPILIPGVKLGLANLVIVVPLYLFGAKTALVISVVRILLVGATFGNLSTMLYSMAGGMLSLLMMVLAKKIKNISPVGVSVVGGVFHNVGQIVVAMLVIESVKLVYYLPVLVISGAVTGFLVGVLVTQVLCRLEKRGQRIEEVEEWINKE